MEASVPFSVNPQRENGTLLSLPENYSNVRTRKSIEILSQEMFCAFGKGLEGMGGTREN